MSDLYKISYNSAVHLTISKILIKDKYAPFIMHNLLLSRLGITLRAGINFQIQPYLVFLTIGHQDGMGLSVRSTRIRPRSSLAFGIDQHIEARRRRRGSILSRSSRQIFKHDCFPSGASLVV